MANRQRIDGEPYAQARSNRSTRMIVVRSGFECFKCGHRKALRRSAGFECSSCKHLQKTKVVA